MRGIYIPDFSMLNQYKNPVAEAGKFAAEYAARKQQEREDDTNRMLKMQIAADEKEQWEKNYALRQAEAKRQADQWERNFALQQEEAKRQRAQEENDNKFTQYLMTIPTTVKPKDNPNVNAFTKFALKSPEADLYRAAKKQAENEAKVETLKALNDFDTGREAARKILNDVSKRFNEEEKSINDLYSNPVERQNKLNILNAQREKFNKETVPLLVKNWWSPEADKKREELVYNTQHLDNLINKKLQPELTKWNNFWNKGYNYAKSLDNDLVPNTHYQDEVFNAIKTYSPSATVLRNIMVPYLQGIADITKEENKKLKDDKITQSIANKLIGLGADPANFKNAEDALAFLANQNNEEIMKKIYDSPFLKEVEKKAGRGDNAKEWLTAQLPRIKEMAKQVDKSNSSDAVKLQNFINKYITPNVYSQLSQWHDDWDLNLIYDPIEDAVVKAAEQNNIDLDEIDELIENNNNK